MTAFTDDDKTAINTIRALAADTVFKGKSGHPGAPMGLAPLGHLLFTKSMNYNPKNPLWANRDRFVLSNGHACVLQYILLHLSGYPTTMDDLKSFRQLNSKTPGHPESHITVGIEVTTGPLGQGFANSVGLAIGEAHMAARFNKPDFELFNNHTFVILGDGCMQEGIASEAASLAGHLKLGKLIAFYDDNHISIDGDTNVAFTEDVTKRFEAYGWHVQSIEDGNHDLEGIARAIEEAKKVTDKPSLIRVRTIIGFGSLNQGTEKVHGSPLKEDDIAQLKKAFGFNPDAKFEVPKSTYDLYHSRAAQGEKANKEWEELFEKYQKAYPKEAAELKRRLDNKLPEDWVKELPRYTPADKPTATRKLSEAVLNKIADVLPELLVGSADLTGSNLTRWKDAVDFQPDDSNLGSYSGRYFRYGVREHAMAGVLNGLDAYGGIIPAGATFLNFITYAWGSVRLSALAGHRVIYIMTHDSIGLGEDGPTHQPIETLAAIRATPNLIDLRPADGNETSGAYRFAIENQTRPSVLALTRQDLPHLEGSSIEKTLKGGYVLQEVDDADVTLVGTGSEVSLCVETAKLLKEQGSVKARVVSMPSTKLFDAQSQEYRASVLKDGIPIVSVEAASTYGWQRYAHESIGIDTFGSSGPWKEVYAHFELVPDKVAEKVKKVVAFYKKEGFVPSLVRRYFH
ncbi:Transketolase [Lobosporangium transversale]|uniref:Transketolase n=1 Tax=Lobosporangium transversale TaxID=64571 RepID=A0A1Y2GJT6_9FUNG|nr:transketolase [Lobosporangium transversale]KAF9917852.1 Transketolase [Lobosporangium transversale]ORZ12988.1 transketolase [Lobosporangium transversale]|eukprot:XP_021880337.1 transketolase [Lobosporangium transversale]